ncbi:MAG: RBBP9/YdeN family alpha/beta hydrolase [Beijerinckiaceae bacterium]
MRTSDCDILIIPGYGNSGPDHWQSRWQQKLSTARRVEQPDWHYPDVQDAVMRLVRAVVASGERPVVLVAHSCGCALVAHAAGELSKLNIAGALMVAPTPEKTIAALDAIDPAYARVPRHKLPFPALVIASQTDECVPITDAQAYASDWGADFTDAGDAGHINVASGHGPWPEGLMRFAGFLKSLDAQA